jgi:hypothetical protein
MSFITLLSHADAYSIHYLLPLDANCLRRRLDTATNLGLETGLDGRDGPTRTARLASEEVETVLLAEERVGRLADLAGDVLD